ncbi:hypothetical protein TWF696_000109 [Orbilia brochopaga]|uniref:AAA+ ATPase domain-containing protein n=1 Tax=Orbilia brochopaga TaxID=3140254 RepID=A0AAV9VA95_9PEZI
MASSKVVKLILQTDDGVSWQLPLELLRVIDDTNPAAGTTSKPEVGSLEGARTADAPTPQGTNTSTTPSSLPVFNLGVESAPVPPQTERQTPSSAHGGSSGSVRHNRPRERGSVLAFVRLDHLYDPKRHNYHLVETSSLERPSYDQYSHLVFVVRRVFSVKNEYQRTLVDVKSIELRDALAASIKNVKGITWTEDRPCLSPDFLVAHEPEIKAFTEKLESLEDLNENREKQLKHAQLLLSYIEEDFRKDREKFEALTKDGLITYELILMLLKPNTVVVAESVLGEPTVLHLRWSEFRKHHSKGDHVFMEASYVESDGKTFRYTETVLELPSFRGSVPITSLAVYPFRYDPQYETLRAELIERGKKFCALQRSDDPRIPGAFRAYNGLRFKRTKDDIFRFHCKGRVMVDTAAFRKYLPDYPGFAYTKATPRSMLHPAAHDPDDEGSGGSNSSSPRKPAVKTRRVSFNTLMDVDKMTDEDFLLCPSTVDGFSFSDKSWGQFSVEKMEDIQWHENAFDRLVLPQNQKTLIRALIESHTSGAHASDEEHPDFDDIIQGKGKGLVMLLHGKPGLGKTLTAESISETLKRPLYVCSAGDLPPDPSKLEVLDVASSWGAVLLIDEADVYLEQRGMSEVTRNALVCVFLRLLEYFKGILILTTNRVRTFDEAFQSRIHVAIAYTELGTDAKIQIWKTFIGTALESEHNLPLTTVPADTGKSKWKDNNTDAAALTDEDYTQLARHDLNGRQIKNAVKAAHALATTVGERLNMKHIREVLEVMNSFDRTFSGAHTGNLYS